MYREDQLVAISALQHLLFCERQCALIHIEQLWAENVLTVEGRQLHERADSGESENRGAQRIARSLPLRSLRLGLIGRADIVEFYFTKRGERPERIVPVEYKRGRAKRDDSDRVQLCAQAICLEEMLGVTIAVGALYYGLARHRTEVVFDGSLRETTEFAASRLHALLDSQITPRAVREPKCESCSLLDLCVPSAMEHHDSASRFFGAALDKSLREPPNLD